MVSARLKKRFIILLVFACAAVMLCFYKIRKKTGHVSPEIKTASTSSSSVSVEGEKVTTEQQNEFNLEQDGEIEDSEVFYQNDTTDREPVQETGSYDTEHQEKIHRGLEENEEIQETLAWLDEIGASVPPTKPASPAREMTSPWNERREDAPTPKSEIRDQPPTLYQRGRSRFITQRKPPSNSSGGLDDELTEREAIEVAGKDRTSNASSTSVKLRSVHAKQFGVELGNQSSNITNSNEDRPNKQSTVSPLSSTTSSFPPPSSKHNVSEELRTTRRTKTPPFTRSSPFQSPAPMYSPTPSPNACKLPNLDPWDPSVRHLLKDVGEDPGCRKNYPLPAFDVVANRLVPNGEINTGDINFQEVNLETIHRDDGDDWNVHFVDRGNPFNISDEEFLVSRVIRESDFFKLRYKLKTGREDGHYFARVVSRNDVIVKSNMIRQNFKDQLKNEGLGLSVLMLGFDSVSSASFRRKMPKTLRYLKDSLKTYIITGQTVIGDGTSPALTAMLAGLHENEAPEGRQGFANSGPIDKWPWLMTLFKEHGYVTMMAEDDPTVGAFNLRLNGFEEPPADHYARPFWLALEDRQERDEAGLCSRSTFMVNYTLDYILSYFESYPDTLKFAFTFMSYLSHAHPNHLSYADNDVLRLLRLFVERGYHNNTLIVIFGDHGSRNDDVRNTMQGKLEERLPWLSMSLPAWLTKRYPDITSALEHNQHVISSPFDLHATLHHVLTYPNDPKGEKTQTLFKKLNNTRTCDEAEIREHWCPCLAFKEVNISHPHVVGGAQAAVRYINDVILNRTELLRKSCATIHLKKILKAFQYKPNEKLQRFRDTNQQSDRAVNFGAPTDDNPHYRINLMTRPGDALFEVTVTIHDENKVTVSPNMSRTNLYGTQPSCILRKIPYARKFCYCK